MNRIQGYLLVIGLVAMVMVAAVGAESGARPDAQDARALVQEPHSHPTYCGKGRFYYQRNPSGYVWIHRLAFHHQGTFDGTFMRFYIHRIYYDGRFLPGHGFWQVCGGR